MRVTAHARTALALALALALTATTGMLTAFPAFGVTPDHEEKICGTVTLPGPYAQDAEVSAVAFQNLGGTWTAVAGEAVNEDGTYCVVLPEPGTYRIGFFDAALVYADTYYLNASSVSVATDIVVSDGSTVNGINQTLTQNPVNVIQGRVNFVGAPGTRVGVEVYRQETIEGELLWTTVHTRMTAEDGTYRIHTPGAGTYRIGFIDFDDIFGHVFYTNAGSVEDAHDVVVTAGTPVSGIDVTMTAQPSTRIFGPNRFATAAAISQRTFEDGFGGTVVLVSGQSAPDGLSSAVLAYALEGPTLLTTNSYIPDVTMEEIRRLSPGEVVIVGGTGVVSLSQEFALRRAGVPIVRRLAGSDRYGTAVEVAREIANRGLYGGGELDVFVANGNSFADALPLGPVAAAAGRPILFVRRDSVPESTREFLDDNGIEAVVVAGGTGVVNEAVADEIGCERRLAGANRYLTAIEVAKYGIDELGMNQRVIGLASGTSFADALAAGPYLGSGRRALLLTDGSLLAPATKSFLGSRKGVFARVIAIGGTSAVSEAAFQEAVNVIR